MTVSTDDRAEIRTLARSVAKDRIAPHAADVDERSQFPHEGYKARVEALLHAVVIPEGYRGDGADALTGAFVAEESRAATYRKARDPNPVDLTGRTRSPDLRILSRA